MTKEEAQARVDTVAEIAGDFERAHVEEDSLYHQFVAWVAEGDSYMAEVAKIVLSTDDIAFPRYCA